jgi:hypothetical protein
MLLPETPAAPAGACSQGILMAPVTDVAPFTEERLENDVPRLMSGGLLLRIALGTAGALCALAAAGGADLANESTARQPSDRPSAGAASIGQQASAGRPDASGPPRHRSPIAPSRLRPG